MLGGMAEGTVQSSELQLHYVEWGTPGSPPLVLLHGMEESARSWDRFAASMSAEYRVVALDFRGHGESRWSGEGRYGADDYVADVRALIDALDLRSIVLCGHSEGGLAAVAFTASHPDLVDALVVADSDLTGGPRRPEASIPGGVERWDSLNAVIARLHEVQPYAIDDTLMHQAVHLTVEADDGTLAWRRDPATVEGFENPAVWSAIDAIGCPSLVLRGRESTVMSHETAVKAREALSRVRLAELESAGHWLQHEIPGAFETTLRWFLENPPK